MDRIRQLPADVVNQIAAGEVIERPASVVKELLENSLDALAGRIDVEIERGGADLIRVTDDGEGIAPEDLPLAVTSHATSKIDSPDDLFRVRTMGFRGEALASIASVSRLRLRSRQADAETAFLLEPSHEPVAVASGSTATQERMFAPEPYEANDDASATIKPTAGPPGTCVEVADLFYNTPVRRKFLKTVSTEFGHICEQFTRIALANPRLHMVLRHNGKEVFSLPATERLLERLVLFHGPEMAEKLIPVESEIDGVRLWGYVGHPSLSKPSRKGQYLFLNGRWITDRALQHALGEAYRGLLMVGRQPVAYLFLEMPPGQVDVNVHPTKAEVRFADGSRHYRQLLSTLRTEFLSLDFESPARMPGGYDRQGPPTGDAAAEGENRRHAQIEFTKWAGQALADRERAVASGESNWSGERTGGQAPACHEEPRFASGGAGGTESERQEPATSEPNGVAVASVESPVRGAASAMQVLDTYLVLETEKGLTLIDQHALHERILYEHLRERTLNGTVETQRLLAPEPIELSAKEAALLLARREDLRASGYLLEEFGGSTVLLAGYPAMLAGADHHALLRDIADALAENTANSPSRRDLLDSMLHMMSCKAAIKAGQRLTGEEIESLLAQRHLVNDAHHCPHGRPTALFLTRDQLDRQFGRMG